MKRFIFIMLAILFAAFPVYGAAVIELHEMSAADTGTDKTSGTVRFKDADNAAVDTANPMVIPGSGTNHSYEKKVRAYYETDDSTTISNLRAYSDGSNGFGTGVTCTYVNIGTTWSANSETDHSGTNLFAATSGSPINMDSVDTGPFNVADVDTYIGDLLELQLHVQDTASVGTLTAETLTVAYDES